MHPDNSGPKQVRGKAGRFQKGSSGNPRGKPQGTRHRATQMAESLIEEDASAIVKAMIEAAKGGCPTSLRLCIERLAPLRRGRPIEFSLPPVKTAADVTLALGSIVASMASGDISPEEAAQVAGVLELKRRSLETTEFEARLALIETKLAGKKP